MFSGSFMLTSHGIIKHFIKTTLKLAELSCQRIIPSSPFQRILCPSPFKASMMSSSSSSAVPPIVVYSIYNEGQRGIRQALQSTCPKVFEACTFITSDDQPLSDESKESLKNAEIILMDPHKLPSLMTLVQNVKWVQSTWAGVDSFINKFDPALLPPKFTLTRCAGVFGDHMAEYVIGQILAYERSFKYLMEAQQRKEWALDEYTDTRGYTLLKGRTISITGAGQIGTKIGAACKVFNMRVIGMVRKDVPKEQRHPAFDEYRKSDDLPYILQEADFIVNVLPSTEQTVGLFSGDTLSHCKKKPVFVNVGRGDVINEESLIKAIKQGWIKHAILDVYDPEPLPQESPLWLMPEVTITPHVSAQTHGPEIAMVFLDNYERYMKGERLQHQLDWMAKY